MPIVMALDIAGRATGACVGGGGRKPSFSTLSQELGGRDDTAYGTTGTIFRRWMIDHISVHKPEHIAIEAPWLPMGNRSGGRNGMTSTRIPRLLIGLAFLAEQIADEFDIECSEAEVSTVRKHFVGHGRPENPKQLVGVMCARLGWNIHNDHEGDAGALWAYTQSMIDPAFSYATTPLLHRAIP